MQGGQTEADLLARLEGGTNAGDAASTSQGKGPVNMEHTAVMMDIATATPAELEPILMSKCWPPVNPRQGAGMAPNIAPDAVTYQECCSSCTCRSCVPLQNWSVEGQTLDVLGHRGLITRLWESLLQRRSLLAAG